MGTHRAAIRYAKSLIELSQEQKSLEKVNEDMRLFTKVTSENRELAVILKNPIIPSGKKKAVIKALFEGKVQPIPLKAFDLIVAKGRENILEEIAVQFASEYNVIKGIVEALVSTPYKLDGEQRKKIIEIVEETTGKKAELKETIDEALIGGFLLKIGDKQVDESVKSKLTKIQRALVA